MRERNQIHFDASAGGTVARSTYRLVCPAQAPSSALQPLRLVHCRQPFVVRLSQYVDEFHGQTSPRLMRGKQQINGKQDRWREWTDLDARPGKILCDDRM